MSPDLAVIERAACGKCIYFATTNQGITKTLNVINIDIETVLAYYSASSYVTAYTMIVGVVEQCTT